MKSSDLRIQRQKKSRDSASLRWKITRVAETYLERARCLVSRIKVTECTGWVVGLLIESVYIFYIFRNVRLAESQAKEFAIN